MNGRAYWHLPGVLCALAAIVLVLQCTTVGVTDGDDESYLVQSSRISQHFWSLFYPDYNAPRPTVDLLFWMCHEVFGQNPEAFGTTVILFHVAVSVMLVAVGRRLGLGWDTCFVASVLFLTITAHFRVFFISGLSYTAGLAFGLATVYSCLGPAQNRAVARSALFTLFLLLSVLAHAALIVLVPFCAFVVYNAATSKKPPIKTVVALLGPATVVAVGAVLPLVYSFSHSLQSYHSLHLPSADHLIKYSLWLLGRLFTTAHWLLVPVYEFPAWELVVGILVLILAVLVGLRNERLEVTWLAWILLMMLPFLNRVPSSFLEGTSGPSRYLYFPSLGLSVLTAIYLQNVTRWLGRKTSANVGKIVFLGCIGAIVCSSLLVLAQFRGFPHRTAAVFQFELRKPKQSTEHFESALRYAGDRVIDREQTYVDLCNSLLIDGSPIAEIVQLGLDEFPNSWKLSTVKTIYDIASNISNGDAAFDVSIAQLTEVDRSDPALRLAAETLSHAADGFLLQNDVPRAVNALVTAVKLHPEKSVALFDLGVLYGKLGRYRDAVEAFGRASKGNPPNADLHYNLGLAQNRLGNNALATGSLQRALDLRPASAEIAYLLGLTYMDLKQPENALAAFNKVLSLKPKLADVHLLSGGIFRWLKREDAANMYHWIGVAYSAVNNHLSAAKFYQKALELNGSRALTHYKLALSYFLLRDPTTARKQIDKLTILDPELAERALDVFKLVTESNRH